MIDATNIELRDGSTIAAESKSRVGWAPPTTFNIIRPHVKLSSSANAGWELFFHGGHVPATTLVEARAESANVARGHCPSPQSVFLQNRCVGFVTGAHSLHLDLAARRHRFFETVGIDQGRFFQTGA
jgi:hypothetical protein